MSANFDTQTIESIIDSIEESERLRRLSNEQLVRECLNHSDYNDADLHIEEMYDRLYPKWAGPLTFKQRVSFKWMKVKRLMGIGRGL